MGSLQEALELVSLITNEATTLGGLRTLENSKRDSIASVNQALAVDEEERISLSFINIYLACNLQYENMNKN